MLYYSNLVTAIIEIILFIIFLMIVGLVFIDFNYDKKIKKQIELQFLIGACFVSWMVLILDVFTEHYINDFITTIIIINMIIISNIINSTKFIIIFNINLLISVFFHSFYHSNQILDGQYILIIILLNLVFLLTLRNSNTIIFDYILQSFIYNVIISLKVLNIYADVYNTLIYTLISISSVIIVFVLYKLIFHHNIQLAHYYLLSVYDIDSNTFSANYLNTEIDKLEHDQEEYSVIFIDILLPKYQLVDYIHEYDGPMIDEITSIIKKEINEQDILGRLTVKRFYILIKENIEETHNTLNNIRTKLEKLKCRKCNFEISMVDNKSGILNFTDRISSEKV